MNDLEVLLNRIRKTQAEREAEIKDQPQLRNGKNVSRDKWREIGFDSGLEWCENEILALLGDNKTKEETKTA